MLSFPAICNHATIKIRNVLIVHSTPLSTSLSFCFLKLGYPSNFVTVGFLLNSSLKLGYLSNFVTVVAS